MSDTTIIEIHMSLAINMEDVDNELLEDHRKLLESTSKNYWENIENTVFEPCVSCFSQIDPNTKKWLESRNL